MPSFFRSNKSQSSIDRFSPSREGSPTHSEAPANPYPLPAPTAPLAQRYPAGQPQYDGASESPEQRTYQESSQTQTHPAHQLARAEGHRIDPAPDAAYKSPGRPSVHITGPSSPNTDPPIYDEHRPLPPSASQLQPVEPEKERRKSKRSIFSLHKEPKESTSPTSGRGPGRAASLLKKSPAGQQGHHSVTISGPYPQAKPADTQYQEKVNHSVNITGHHPQVNPADTEHQEPLQQSFYRSQESLTDPENRPSNEQYYQQGQDQLDQPRSQPGVQAEGHFRGEPRHSQQYQGDRERQSEESAETYFAYQQHQQEQRGGEEDDSAAFDPRQIRPPSQLSLLGPPSPGTQSADSRPSSATNQSNPSRFSTQSTAAVGPQLQQQQQQQQHTLMARGDPPSNGLRDQMNQQRDPRMQDSSHGQYNGQQDPRTRVSQHPEQGRSTPPPRSREDNSSMDFQTLLQRYEELRKSFYYAIASSY